MEYYYFIQESGSKQGPFKLAELKQQTIYFDELIWRSDNDQWKKASEFEELKDTFIIKPPLTPLEQKITDVNKNFVNIFIGQLVLFYIVTSFLIGFISYSIASSSWEKYLKDTGGKYLGNNYSSSYSSGLVSDEELIANKRYPTYTPGLNNESYHGSRQGFLFRPFKAFFSTVYLTEEEQKNSATLFIDLTLSSFISLSFIFFLIGIIYYGIERSSIQKELDATQVKSPDTNHKE